MARRKSPSKGMKILMVSSECAPFAKVGGLADVVPALAKAMTREGHRVRVCVPWHRDGKGYPASDTAPIPVEVPFPGSPRPSLRLLPGDGYEALVAVEEPGLFGRAGIYDDPETSQGYGDNVERFALFSAVAAKVASGALGDFRPDVIHCHDHQAGLVPAFLRHGPAGLRAAAPMPVVYTIHNLAYQGLGDLGLATGWGLDAWLAQPTRALEFHGRLNLMKAGIALADRVTTVSPTYADEICTAEFGEGLDGLLRERRDVLHGILNGVDTEVWNPSTDAWIQHHYSARSLAGKRRNRKALLEELELEPAGPATPVLGVVSRLAGQKGLDLLLEVVDQVLALDVRLVVLGSGEEALSRGFRQAAARHAGRLAAYIGFDEGLAHRIEAGSDVFLMPSRYEPCGLNQMYSLFYGTLPLVRATGGLADTVIDVDEDPDRANGFVFRVPIAAELIKTIRRAVRMFRDRKTWKAMMLRGMTTDWSWDAAARRYLALYGDAAQGRTAKRMEARG